MIKLVLDTNILFSLMKPNSVASSVFSLLNTDFFAPEFIISELNVHKEECLSKSKLSEHEFKIRQTEVEGRIKFCKLPEYKTFLKSAISSLPDIDDSPYLALALSLNAKIWSNDKHFKQQSLVKALSTKELIDKLLKNEI